MIKRKLASATTPVMEIKQSGNHFYIKTTTTLTSQELDFTAGEKYKADIPGITSGKWDVSV